MAFFLEFNGCNWKMHVGTSKTEVSSVRNVVGVRAGIMVPSIIHLYHSLVKLRCLFFDYTSETS